MLDINSHRSHKALIISCLFSLISISAALGPASAQPSQPSKSQELSPTNPPMGKQQDAFAHTQIAIYVLSRASGVPPRTLETSRTVRSYLANSFAEGKAMRLEETTIGLEGETRLCAEFTTKDLAQAAFDQLSPIIKGVELINMSAEPCIQAN